MQRRKIVCSDVFEVGTFLSFEHFSPACAKGGTKITDSESGAIGVVTHFMAKWRSSEHAELLDLEIRVGTVQGRGVYTPAPRIEKECARATANGVTRCGHI